MHVFGSMLCANVNKYRLLILTQEFNCWVVVDDSSVVRIF